MYFWGLKIRKILLYSPLFFTYLFGRVLGSIFYASKKKRRNAFRNIKTAFPNLPYKQADKIIKHSFINYGLTIAEAFVPQRIQKNIKVIGQEHIDKAKGGIFVAIHEGSWETYNAWFSNYLKKQYIMFVKQQKTYNFASFINDLRNIDGLTTTDSIKDIIKALQNNAFLGMVIDQGMDSAFIYLDFFSQVVPTPTGAVFLAQKYNKPIYPCFGYRQGGLNHTIEVMPAVSTEGKTQEEVLSSLHRIFEQYLTKYPQEYVWSYKRFKKKKNLDVIILSDRKTGHVKQSLAFVAYLKEQQGVVSSKIIELRYKSKMARTLSDIFASIIPKRLFKSARIYRYFLDKEVALKLENSFADIIISTGSFVAPINKLLAAVLTAKSVVIMKPNIGLSNFDLAIIPKHDSNKVNKAKNVFTITGALSYPSNLEDKIIKCKDYFKLSSKKKIAIFIGGAYSNKNMFLANIRIFMREFKKYSLDNNYLILLSTSRRTTNTVEMFLEEFIEKELPNVEAIVYPSRQNYDFAFEGFVALADIVFVTAESISMVSEVIAQDKPVVAINLENYDHKRQEFYKSLTDNVESVSKPYNLDKLSIKKPAVAKDNNETLKKALEVLTCK